MAEEDLIFGKNRHFFGGIEPSNMRKFQAFNQSTGIKLSLTFPKNTVVDAQTLCSIAGVVVRKNTDDYPKDEFSGVEVANIVFDGNQYDYKIIDIDVESGVTYYYSAFPYTTQGVYNRNAALDNSPNRATATYGKLTYGYLYGYDLDLNDPNPETRVTYPEDVDNYGWSYAYANMTGANYGLEGLDLANGWGKVIQPGVDFTPRPCMLNFEGTVAEYLDPYDYGKTIDGLSSTLNTNDNFTSNAMMEWPKIYTKREEIDGVYKFRCSDVQIDDDWECWCNYDRYGNVIDHFYTAIYQFTSNAHDASSVPIKNGSQVRSLRNCKYTYISSSSSDINNIDEITNLVRATNGIDWDIEQLCDRLLINDLLVMICGSTDVESKFGQSIVNSNATYSYENSYSGADIHNYGLFYGDCTNGSGSTMVKIFGMVNWYGCRYRAVSGIGVIYNKYFVKLTRSTRDGSNIDDYTASEMTRYKMYSDVIEHSTTISGFMNKALTTSGGRLPICGNGSETTYEADGFSYTHNNHLKVALVGGHISRKGGPFHFHMNNSYTNLGLNVECTTSLSCKPSKVE